MLMLFLYVSHSAWARHKVPFKSLTRAHWQKAIVIRTGRAKVASCDMNVDVLPVRNGGPIGTE